MLVLDQKFCQGSHTADKLVEYLNEIFDLFNIRGKVIPCLYIV
jgi:hypothetical protein